MGKYTSLQSDVFSIFNANAWKAENIPTIPSNFSPPDPLSSYIRVTIVPGTTSKADNLNSVSGQLMIDIFTATGLGPSITHAIADKLDTYLVGKSVSTLVGSTTQLLGSTLSPPMSDSANPSLSRSIYTIPFNYFGI